MATSSATAPHFFGLPREIRNRIYFWIIAKDLDLKRSEMGRRATQGHKQIHFNVCNFALRNLETSRGKVAANVLANTNILTSLFTSQTFMVEFMEELSIACSLPPAVESKCDELHLYGLDIGGPGALQNNLVLLELFLRYITPDVSFAAIHIAQSTETGLMSIVKEHFLQYGATVTSKHNMAKNPSMLKLQIRGRSYSAGFGSGSKYWHGQTTVLAGHLNDFLRPQWKSAVN